MPFIPAIGAYEVFMGGSAIIGGYMTAHAANNIYNSMQNQSIPPPSPPGSSDGTSSEGDQHAAAGKGANSTSPQTPPGPQCDNCKSTNKKTPKDVLSDATRDPDTPTLQDGTEQYTKPGGMQDAESDFNSMDPQNVQSKGGGVQTGQLSDGTQLVVRPQSVPSLEINPPSGTSSIIRYK